MKYSENESNILYFDLMILLGTKKNTKLETLCTKYVLNGYVIGIQYNKVFKLVFLLFCGLFNTFCIKAQKSLIDVEVFRALKSSEQRIAYINHDRFRNQDTTLIRASINQLYPVITEKNDFLCLYYWHYLRWRVGKIAGIGYEEPIQSLKEIADQAALKGYPVEAVHGHLLYYVVSYSQNKYSIGEVYMVILQDYEKMQQLGFERFKVYNIGGLLFSISQFMHNIDDQDKAFEYLKVAEQYVRPVLEDDYTYTLVLNYLEDHYVKTKDYQKAIECNQKVYDFHNSLVQTDRTAVWKSISLLNLAWLYVKVGKLKEGEDCALEGYALSKVKPKQLFRGSQLAMAEFDALQPLIAVKLELGKRSETEHLFNRCRLLSQYLIFDGLNYFKPLKWYENNYKYYEGTQNMPQAFQYLKLLKEMEDSLSQRNDVHKISQIKTNSEIEKYSTRIQLLENEKQYQKLLRLATLFILALLFGIAYFNYWRIKEKHQFEAQKLQVAIADLEIFRKNLFEKAQLAEALQLEINNLALKNENSSHLEHLYQSTILTDDDWKKFKVNFEKVHPHFIAEQKKLYPDLTPAELRFLVLEKLGLEIKEMANMIGVSRNTIIQTRLRLKKKITS